MVVKPTFDLEVRVWALVCFVKFKIPKTGQMSSKCVHTSPGLWFLLSRLVKGDVTSFDIIFIRVNNSPKYGTKQGPVRGNRMRRAEQKLSGSVYQPLGSAQLGESAVRCPDPESFKCKFKFNSETHSDVTWARRELQNIRWIGKL